MQSNISYTDITHIAHNKMMSILFNSSLKLNSSSRRNLPLILIIKCCGSQTGVLNNYLWAQMMHILELKFVTKAGQSAVKDVNYCPRLTIL